jgi:hypothetical protein
MGEELVFSEKRFDIPALYYPMSNQLSIHQAIPDHGQVEAKLVDKIPRRFAFRHPQADQIREPALEGLAHQAAADTAA